MSSYKLAIEVLTANLQSEYYSCFADEMKNQRLVAHTMSSLVSMLPVELQKEIFNVKSKYEQDMLILLYDTWVYTMLTNSSVQICVYTVEQTYQ